MIIQKFKAFYPTYLRMHSNRSNRRLHVVGNLIGLVVFLLAVGTQSWLLLVASPVIVNTCAWFGHFRFQKNRPGVFTYPLLGIIGSWVMTWDILRGKMRF